MRQVFGLALAAVLWASNSLAGGVALVLSVENYENLPDATSSAALLQTTEKLEELGFLVLSGSDLTAEELRAQLAGSFEQILREEAARVVIALSGHFAHSGSGTWLMGAEAAASGLALVEGQGLSLATVGEIAAQAGEAAVIWLAPSANAPDPGAGLRAGLPETLGLPADIALIRGPVDQVVAGLTASLRPGVTLASIARSNRALTGSGALPARTPFLPEGFAPGARADLRAWAEAEEADTEEAYQAYLAAFPNGENAQAARAALEAIRSAPDRIEAALFLTTDERRAIQRDLTTLGLDTRGIDGIFGPGTRGAIGVWQERNDLAATQFLDRDQIFTLAAQAAERAAEVEAEERARREAEERADRDFWALTGAAGDEPGLRSYLERYPEGIFAGLAQDRLAQFAASAQAAREAEDLDAWRRARALDTVGSYEAYLSQWPEGAFRTNAQARLEMRRPQMPAEAAQPEPASLTPAETRARAAEQALNLPQSTRLLIEQRLARLGLDPGPVDGVFDAQTRVAIRQAQERFDLFQTGYVDQNMLAMLVSNLFREFFN